MKTPGDLRKYSEQLKLKGNVEIAKHFLSQNPTQRELVLFSALASLVRNEDHLRQVISEAILNGSQHS